MQAEFKALGIFKTSKGEDCGMWFIRMEGERAGWHCLGRSTGNQIKEIVRISTKYGRDVHINTGGKYSSLF